MLRILYLKFKYLVTKKNWYDISNFIPIKKFISFEKILGYKIYRPKYYFTALTHRSFLEMDESSKSSNERLEFLGDAVIDLIVGKYLFNNFPDDDEGFLTKTRSMLVNKSALYDAAKRIELDKFILVSDNYSKTLPNGSKSVLSDAYEALIGAIYLDKGLGKAENFVIKTLAEPSFNIKGYLKDNNFKSQLLEHAQKEHIENIEYYVVKEEGPQHQKSFTVEVKLNNNVLGTGSGKNKKSAEQNAAKNALQKIKIS
ncbi:MAG: ribonuclease III [Ignavibacteriales bacterium CG12_big_fil_rev_8_21_14_0_65_30_8]|nr:MAG: ribonuclease III [Ignavibacteriales bacterium CG12_big_fil_rev_8_21_14_0_65_30_8]